MKRMNDKKATHLHTLEMGGLIVQSQFWQCV